MTVAGGKTIKVCVHRIYDELIITYNVMYIFIDIIYFCPRFNVEVSFRYSNVKLQHIRK